ncbi:hypothetical protein [Saliphagus infecundisoli]|uniref:Uncharacterized protein n=1 Tax=Saliphagus infecundisoli TaxID=1849069 RepID=A0ABD5QB91_9EURY|nr:hypothetical protein [Saliphagus infecundisoli]
MDSSAAIGGVAALPGCTASDGLDVVLDYFVSTGSKPDMIPEDARDHDGQDGYEWVVVEIAVDESELNMEDMWFNSRIETEDGYHDLDRASGEIPERI